MPVHPSRPRGPHLNAMRSFEAAARLGGFAAAAEELCVTSGAISQQIKALEDWVGAPLFERRSQGVRLTELGRQVAGDFSQAFDALGGALHRLRAQAPEAAINIAALPAIAQLWLSPRLPHLRRAFPNQTVSVTALELAPNLARDLFDVSLFLGTPCNDPAEFEIAQDMIFPVCAPEIAARIAAAKDLDNVPLIQDTAWSGDWPLWRARMGLDERRFSGAHFSLYSIALEEARNGAGVMMGHSWLVARDLAQGTLVAPLQGQVATGQSLLLRTPAPIKPQMRLYRWIRALLEGD
ncbi:MAG: LysR family transcriptional regulator [Planktotalea sp.]|uniref:LysR family transcriptional regulator n=1 Tax=Planktotalea sp. TaxID=2029877 RepID=UPI003C754AB0